MEQLLRLGIVISLVLLGLVANLVVMAGLWSLRQVQNSTLPARRFSTVVPHVLDRLLGAATLTATLLALVAGASQLPVHAFGKLLVAPCHVSNLFQVQKRCCKVIYVYLTKVDDKVVLFDVSVLTMNLGKVQNSEYCNKCVSSMKYELQKCRLLGCDAVWPL
jgi:hypothetical protein